MAKIHSGFKDGTSGSSADPTSASDSERGDKVTERHRVRPLIRHAYSPSVRLSIFCPGGRTKQSFKDECDINFIMARYERTGVLPDASRLELARYADMSGFDFQDAMMLVAGAKSAFMELPAELRAQFDNDPGKLVHFMNVAQAPDAAPDVRAEAVRLGLLKDAPEGDKPVLVRLDATSGGGVAPPPVASVPERSTPAGEGSPPIPASIQKPAK